MSDAPQCEKLVSEPPWYIHTHQCQRKGRYQIEDPEGNKAAVCGTHRNGFDSFRGAVTVPEYVGVQR